MCCAGETMISKKKLAELKRLAKNASPGKWEYDEGVEWKPKQKSPFEDSGATVRVGDAYTGKGEFVVMGGAQDEQGGAVGVLKNADAAFIVAACNSAGDLVSEIETLGAQVRLLRKALKHNTYYSFIDCYTGVVNSECLGCGMSKWGGSHLEMCTINNALEETK